MTQSNPPFANPTGSWGAQPPPQVQYPAPFDPSRQWHQPPMWAYPYPPSQPGRPGIITAVGVVSIVLASFGLLWAVGVTATFVGHAMTPQEGAAVGMPAGMTAPAGSISAEDADLIVTALSSVHPLPAADQARLAAAMQKVELPLMPPTPGQPWMERRVVAQVNPDMTGPQGGQIVFQLHSGGSIILKPSEIVFSSISGSGTSVSTVRSEGQVTTDSERRRAMGGGSAAPAVAGVVTNLLNVVAAVLLLVAGIQTLRNSTRGPQLHRSWAWLKIVLVVMTTAAGLWWTYSAGGGGDNPEQMRPIMLAVYIGLAVTACIYPVVVLVVFGSRRVRGFYGEGAAQPSAVPPMVTGTGWGAGT